MCVRRRPSYPGGGLTTLTTHKGLAECEGVSDVRASPYFTLSFSLSREFVSATHPLQYFFCRE